MPVIVPMPSGNWGIGPSLLYLVGMVGLLIYVIASTPKDPRKERQERDEEAERKRKADESFAKALAVAAEERAKNQGRWKC